MTIRERRGRGKSHWEARVAMRVASHPERDGW